MPIPLYYFPAIIGDIEQAYLLQAADDNRGYNLQTDYHWEKSLPNLNPRNSELVVDWSLTMLAKGLSTRAITERKDDHVFVYTDSHGEKDELGKDLSSVLYHLTDMHEKLKEEMQQRIESARNNQSAQDTAERDHALANKLDRLVHQIHRREGHGESTREDLLERPILRALVRILRQSSSEQSFATTPKGRYSFD